MGLDMRTGYIYKIENTVNGKLYIGKAVSPKIRWSRHINALANRNHVNKHLQAAWEKYGAESFRFSVIEVCDLECCNDIEKKWIADTGSLVSGYNKTAGGDGVVGVPMPPQTRAAIRAANIGRTLNQRQKDALAKSNRQPKSDMAKKNMSDSAIKRFQRDGVELNRLVGRSVYEANKDAFISANEARRKPVRCTTDSLLFSGIGEAAKHYRIDKSNISRVASGKQKQIKGLTFAWG